MFALTPSEPKARPSHGRMEDIRSIWACFPEREFDIRYHRASDPDFGSICADYEQTTSVPGYWRNLVAPRDKQYAAHDRTRSVVLIQVNEECRDSTLYFFALRTSETPREIGAAIRLPQSLATQWACRSYYGAVYHDAVAQYNLRLGFFDGVPANLNRRTPEESAQRYVTFMGGADNVLRQAKESFDKGDYRWVAEVVNHVVFADAENMAAKHLLADAYEQLGYQAESGPWRNFYLTGALELRRGVTKLPVASTASPDTIRAMPIEMFFDYLGVRLNGDRAAGKTLEFNLELTDTGDKYVLGIENSAIHYSKGRTSANADASVVMTRAALNDVMLGAVTMEKQIVNGKAKVSGDPRKLAEFISCLDTFEFWFNIVTA